MADQLRYSVSVTPLEAITDENEGTHYCIAGEVGKSLGGSGTAAVADYSGTAAVQGYANGTVNYLEAPDGVGNEVAISTEASASGIFIRNTGHVYDSATVLGVENLVRRVKVTVESGTVVIACLGAGAGIVLSGLQSGDATLVASGIKVETVDSDGSESAGGVHLAVEILVVD